MKKIQGDNVAAGTIYEYSKDLTRDLRSATQNTFFSCSVKSEMEKLGAEGHRLTSFNNGASNFRGMGFSFCLFLFVV